MHDIKTLLHKMASEEARARETTFLAPCVLGGLVRTRIAGIVQTFTPHPRDFEGWGLFRAGSGDTADRVEEADLPLIEAYLKRLLPLRVRLAYPLRGKIWLAYPVNESDMQQRVGSARPLPVNLVEDGRAFEQVIARSDGAAWWFEEIDRRADPEIVDNLRHAQQQVTPPEALRIKGLTPEMRTVYDLIAQEHKAFHALMMQHRDEGRLRHALASAGGNLRDFLDKGEFWQVEWMTRDGTTRRSAIGKQDLTVISSGICLSGEDQKFDLQSLVGVIEKREPGYWDDEDYE